MRRMTIGKGGVSVVIMAPVGRGRKGGRGNDGDWGWSEVLHGLYGGMVKFWEGRW